MSGVNPHRGEVAFDLFAGKPGYETLKPGDVVLRFTNDDLAKIESDTGVSGIRDISAGIQAGSVKLAIATLFFGLKSSATGKQWCTNRNWLSDTPFAIGEATPLIGDALVWNLYGKTAEELVADYQKARAEEADGGDALDDDRPFRSSTGSSKTEL